MYYGKVCNSSCFNHGKCDYCRHKNSINCTREIRDCYHFSCKYSDYSVNTTPRNICQNPGV